METPPSVPPGEDLNDVLPRIFADLRYGRFQFREVSSAPAATDLDEDQAAFCTGDNKLYLKIGTTLRSISTDAV